MLVRFWGFGGDECCIQSKVGGFHVRWSVTRDRIECGRRGGGDEGQGKVG